MELRGITLLYIFFPFFLFLWKMAAARSLEQPRYDTAYACESKTLKIECKDGELIHLIRANYGRFSITICNDHGNTEWSVNCMSPKSLRVLHTKCSQQQNCSILASTSMFGDPCPGTLKYLEAHYQCMPAATTTIASRPSPPWLITSPPGVWNTAKSATLKPVKMLPNMSDNSFNSSSSSFSVSTISVVNFTKDYVNSLDDGTVRGSSGFGSGGGGDSDDGDNSGNEGGSKTDSHNDYDVGHRDHNSLVTTDSSSITSLATSVATSTVLKTSVFTDNANFSSADNSTISTTLKPISSTTHKINTGVSSSVLEFVPSPSVTLLQEGESLLCSPISSRNLFWNWTKLGDVYVQPCPGGATGLARWRCGAHLNSFMSGHFVAWTPETPDLSECRSVWLTSLESRVQEGDSIISISNELAQVTSSKTLYGGDMMITTKIIKKMAQRMAMDIQSFPDQRQREAIVTELLHGVVVTGSNLLDSAQHPSWQDLSHKEQMRVATSLLMGLEENAFLLADTVVHEKTIIQNVKNILLNVRVVETHNIGTEQFPSPSVFNQWKVSQDWLQIPRAALLENSEGGLVRLVFVAFNHLEDILQPQSDPSTFVSVGESDKNDKSAAGKKYTRNVTKVLNSKVISASLGKGRHIQLSKPVRLSLRHLKTENVSNPLCVFWDFTISSWSDEGCHVESTNNTHTICECDHLTNFAVLMDVYATYLPPHHQAALQIITYIGCIISVVCLILAIITFHVIHGLKSDRTTIHKNLCMCLLVAEVLFLAGIGQTDKPIICSIVAGLLHFFFLCAFAWMFLEGFQLYVMLIEVFETEKSRIRWYYLFAYGAPFIIVGISSVIDPVSYGTERYCWLRADNFFIFSFVGPVIAVILANLVFLSMAIYVMCHHTNTSASLKSKEHSRLASARAWLRGAIILVFLLGLTWTFGLLYLNKESVIMAYIFTVLNSLQGLFIFVFHCIQNDKVQKEYRKFIWRQSWLPKCLRCSVHSNGKERHSSLYAGSNGNPSAPNSHSTDSSALSPHGTSLFLQQGWTSHNSIRGKQHNLAATVHSHKPVNPSTKTTNPADQEVEVCVSTLPYAHGCRKSFSNFSKSASIWGLLHKSLLLKNISFKSYSQDSGHGGSEQDSPRSHCTPAPNNLNNQRGEVTNTNAQFLSHSLSDTSHRITNDTAAEYECELVDSSESLQFRGHQHQLLLHSHNIGKLPKKSAGNFYCPPNSRDHTYTEVRDGLRGHIHNHLFNHLHTHGRNHNHGFAHSRRRARASTSADEDPVYEEIKHSEIQVSDMSDEDGKRQSDVSRQSSRSCSDHHPLIPYATGTKYNMHSCVDQSLRNESRQQSQHLLNSNYLPKSVSPSNSYLYSSDNACAVAVLDGETVVCHIEPDHQLHSHELYDTKAVPVSRYSEC